MASRFRLHRTDLRAASRLAVEATSEVTDLVEAMHAAIASPLATRGGRRAKRARGIAGLVYRTIRWVTRWVGSGLEVALSALEPVLAEPASSPSREAVVAALNGVLGDQLAARGNPLAIPMQARSGGRRLALDRTSLAASFPAAGGHLLLLVHGLCRNDLHWTRAGHDHGAALARDLGFCPVYLHYNTGLHVSENGRAASRLLEELTSQWPVAIEELAILAHSLGGLVARSAIHYAAAAGHRWPALVRQIGFLGTPHHGAPLERRGHAFETLLGGVPYAAPLARLGRLRSAGITDLRYGNLLDEDWEGSDRFASGGGDRRHPMPLPAGVACYAIAAMLGQKRGDRRDRLFSGDGLVPVASAFGDHSEAARQLGIPDSRRFLASGMSHLELLSDPSVYERLRSWLAT